jgi:mRNA interferase RelE/StbE
MNRLPLSAAAAMFEHPTGPVAENPQQLGKQLEAPLESLWSTRRGEYRAIYAIDDDRHSVTVVAVAPRRDACRSSQPTDHATPDDDRQTEPNARRPVPTPVLRDRISVTLIK